MRKILLTLFVVVCGMTQLCAQVDDAFHGVLQDRHFVIMSCEERTDMAFGYEFRRRPCDGQTIVGAGTAPDFVEQHQAPRRHIIQDARRLVHLLHEGRLARRDVVGGAYAGKDLIHQTNT